MKPLLAANVALPALALDDEAAALVEMVGGDEAELARGSAVLAIHYARRALPCKVVLDILAQQEGLRRATVRAAYGAELAARLMFAVFLQLALPRAPTPPIFACHLERLNGSVSYDRNKRNIQQTQSGGGRDVRKEKKKKEEREAMNQRAHKCDFNLLPVSLTDFPNLVPHTGQALRSSAHVRHMMARWQHGKASGALISELHKTHNKSSEGTARNRHSNPSTLTPVSFLEVCLRGAAIGWAIPTLGPDVKELVAPPAYNFLINHRR